MADKRIEMKTLSSDESVYNEFEHNLIYKLEFPSLCGWNMVYLFHTVSLINLERTVAMVSCYTSTPRIVALRTSYCYLKRLRFISWAVQAVKAVKADDDLGITGQELDEFVA
uniref:Uncharacterized protein n=1 Tax=Rhodnius prolixus TaxID=13249 RepID=T1IDX1_RHOPR